VLIGEASHGTHEFYETRIELTKRLILEKGFNTIIIEADFPEAYLANRYVTLQCSLDSNANQALSDFKRFPSWMWRNMDVLNFIEWLRDNNKNVNQLQRTNFLGMDLYSLHSSMNAVITYLETHNSSAADMAKKRYSCFDQFGSDIQTYGLLTNLHPDKACNEHCIAELRDIHSKKTQLCRDGGMFEADEYFFAEQNARVVKNAEEYYRSMFRGRNSNWNIRDSHMVETITNLISHYKDNLGKEAKIVVWAHNSHLGDARYTDMGTYRDEVNVGQLMREKYGNKVFNIGFTTFCGTVTAARNWGSPPKYFRIVPGLEGSYENLFHDANIGNFSLLFRGDDALKAQLKGPLLERAIGVIYCPKTERVSHYFDAQITRQFDAIIHIDKTTPVIPLDTEEKLETGDLPETYPESE